MVIPLLANQDLTPMLFQPSVTKKPEHSGNGQLRSLQNLRYLSLTGVLYHNKLDYNFFRIFSTGAVPRTVCFSMYYSCYCSYTQSIYVKNCGNFYVYWLNSVPSCNLRYCGAKGISSVLFKILYFMSVV